MATDPLHAVLDSEVWLHTVFERAPVGLALLDRRGVPLRVNPALERMLGWPAGELLSAPLLERAEPEDPAGDATLFHELLAGDRERCELERRFRTPDGAPLRARLGLSLVRDARGRPAYALATLEEISDHRTGGERLREALQSFRTLFDSVTEAVYVQDAEGRFLAVNRALERMYGYAGAELLGQTPAMLADPERTDMEMVRERFTRAFAGEPQQLEFWGRRKNGRSFPNEVVLSPTTFFGEPAVIGTARDVTARKAAEEMLESERAHLEQLFESSPHGVVLVDTMDRVLRINSEFTALFGYGEGEAVGRTLQELILPRGEDAAALDITRRIAAGERVRLDTQRRHKDGTLLDVSVTGAPVRIHGHQVAVYGIYQDIRGRKELERRLQQLSTTDPLTGLLNRRGFLELAEREAALAARRKQHLLLLYVDLDEFKPINDRFGHAEGDRLLQEVASLLRSCFRATDLIARMGGDEFVVVAVEAGESTEAMLTDRLRDSVEAFNRDADRPYRLSMSIGAYRARPTRGTPLESLLAEADRRMYQQKRSR